MSPLPSNLRHERKLIARGLCLAEVIALVKRHPAGFREVYPPRTVNNVYLDSPALRDYFDHVNGTPDRAKTRIRWYGPLTGPIEKPALERKVKRGQVSGKLTQPLPPFTFNGDGPRAALDALLEREPLDQQARWVLSQLQPSLVNRYRRHYFLSADRKFRLTVDDALEFHRADTAIPDRPLAPAEPLAVLELKYDPAHGGDAHAITNAFPFRLTRCSKYVLGIERLHGA